MSDASTYSYSHADPESNVMNACPTCGQPFRIPGAVYAEDHPIYCQACRRPMPLPDPERALEHAVADAAVAWIDQGGCDRGERLKRAAEAIREYRRKSREAPAAGGGVPSDKVLAGES